jgi:DNA-directed RNA polymerase specialized sigma24 family protein
VGDNVRTFRWKKTGETSAADLVRECGEKLTDPALWTEFQERFQGLIFLYLMRSLRLTRIQDDAAGIVPDLAQEVYLKVVQHDGRILRGFRGTTEFSVMAFLARIAASVAHDHQRRDASERRRGQVVSIDSAQGAEWDGKAPRESPEFDSSQIRSILSWIDIDRVVEGDPDAKNTRRNALIFKLHYIDGFESAEIARFPGFELTKSGVDTVLARLRKRIQDES